MRKIDELINAGEAASGSNDGAASATTAISGKPETSPGPGLIKKRKKSKPRSESAAGGVSVAFVPGTDYGIRWVEGNGAWAWWARPVLRYREHKTYTN